MYGCSVVSILDIDRYGLRPVFNNIGSSLSNRGPIVVPSQTGEKRASCYAWLTRWNAKKVRSWVGWDSWMYKAVRANILTDLQGKFYGRHHNWRLKRRHDGEVCTVLRWFNGTYDVLCCQFLLPVKLNYLSNLTVITSNFNDVRTHPNTERTYHIYFKQTNWFCGVGHVSVVTNTIRYCNISLDYLIIVDF